MIAALTGGRDSRALPERQEFGATEAAPAGEGPGRDIARASEIERVEL